MRRTTLSALIIFCATLSGCGPITLAEGLLAGDPGVVGSVMFVGMLVLMTLLFGTKFLAGERQPSFLFSHLFALLLEGILIWIGSIAAQDVGANWPLVICSLLATGLLAWQVYTIRHH